MTGQEVWGCGTIARHLGEFRANLSRLPPVFDEAQRPWLGGPLAGLRGPGACPRRTGPDPLELGETGSGDNAPVTEEGPVPDGPLGVPRRVGTWGSTLN